MINNFLKNNDKMFYKYISKMKKEYRDPLYALTAYQVEITALALDIEGISKSVEKGMWWKNTIENRLIENPYDEHIEAIAKELLKYMDSGHLPEYGLLLLCNDRIEYFSSAHKKRDSAEMHRYLKSVGHGFFYSAIHSILQIQREDSSFILDYSNRDTIHKEIEEFSLTTSKAFGLYYLINSTHKFYEKNLYWFHNELLQHVGLANLDNIYGENHRPQLAHAINILSKLNLKYYNEYLKIRDNFNLNSQVSIFLLLLEEIPLFYQELQRNGDDILHTKPYDLGTMGRMKMKTKLFSLKFK